MSPIDSEQPKPEAVKTHQRRLLVLLACCLGLSAVILASQRTYDALFRVSDHDLAIWGMILAVWGIVLSLVGFGVTWMQLVRTRTATVAVNIALSSIRDDYAAFDSISSVHALKSDLQTASDSLASDRWHEALSAMERVRANTITISNRGTALPLDRRDALKDRLVFVDDAANTLVKYRKSKPPKAVVDAILIEIRAFHSMALELDMNLREAIHGGNI